MSTTRPPVSARRSFSGAGPALDGLLDTRFTSLARNTIDYWMLPEREQMTEEGVLRAMEQVSIEDDSTVQLYLHVPFCAQRCRFCAFSGGNSLDFRQAERFSRLLVRQLKDLVKRVGLGGRWIRAVNIGGGSPDLLGPHVGRVLDAVRDLDGCDDRTELAVELTLSTTHREFVEELVRTGVMKVSFGVQSLDPVIRGHLRQPESIHHLDRVLEWVGGRIPVVNGDLITGLPGQSLEGALADLRILMEDPRITGVSSYVLTEGAAPSLIAALRSGEIPPLPSSEEHARMRLMTYAAFARAGWPRRGTNTYYDPSLPESLRDRLTGNECIGTRRYEDLLLGVGPQAVSSLPGVRAENRVDIEGWCRAVENGDHPFHLPKCANVHQKDIALWAFPLRWEGLPRATFEKAHREGAFSERQIETLNRYVEEGLVLETEQGYELSILGEVFMGHLVRGLKSVEGRRAVDEYIREGEELGEAISTGLLTDRNEANNRQLAEELLSGSEIGRSES